MTPPELRLSVVTDEIDQDLARALDVALELGVREVELRTLWDKNVIALDADEAAHARRLLDERGVALGLVGTSIFKCFLWDDRRRPVRDTYFPQELTFAEHVGLIEPALRLADRLGARWIRVFSCWREDDPSSWGRLLDRFGAVVRLAERHPHRLALENISHCNVATGAEAGRFLRDLGSPPLGLVWDPGNALWADEQPYPEGYAHVRRLPSHVHVKDLRVPTGGGRRETVPVGEGEVDYRGQLRALWDDGYRGPLTLEPEYVPPGGTREDGTRAAAAGLRAVLADLPGGG